MLATLAQLRARTGHDGEAGGSLGTDHDALLTAILVQVSARLAGECGRVANGLPCLERTSLTWIAPFVDRRMSSLVLPAWPVVSVTSISEALDGAHDATTLLTADDWVVHAAQGLLVRRGGWWLEGFLTVKAVFSAGYTPPDVSGAQGYTPVAGEVLLPADITAAALMQAAFWYQRRKEIGVSSSGAMGGSITTYARDELLPEVRDAMRAYRRMVG